MFPHCLSTGASPVSTRLGVACIPAYTWVGHVCIPACTCAKVCVIQGVSMRGLDRVCVWTGEVVCNARNTS